MVNTIAETTMPAVPCTGNSLNLTQLFRRAGLPHRVTASATFAQQHGILEGDRGLDQHYDLAWAVRCAVTGLLPVLKFATPHGEVLITEYLSLPEGKPDPVNITVGIIVTATTLHLVLPDEPEAAG
jgi:hypothetical protein